MTFWVFVILVISTPADLRRHGAAAADKGPFLAGRLLVASKKLRDPNFMHSVVYLVRHDISGAIGVIVNRPGKEFPLAALLKNFGLPSEDETRRIKRHFGGPVDTNALFILHTPDFQGINTLVADGGLAMSANRDILQAIAENRGPSKMKIMVGYSGWGAGQLESEIARGDWLDAAADPRVVLDSQGSAKEQWHRARDKAGLTL